MGLNVNIIRESFAKITPNATFFINQFYKNLFQMYPHSQEFFRSVDMEKQKKQLTNALVFIVQNLENTEALTTALKDMGRRHVNYGTKDEHYNWVGSAMMKTLADYFEADWSPEYKSNWEGALMMIARTMIEGTRENPSPRTQTSPENSPSVHAHTHNHSTNQSLSTPPSSRPGDFVDINEFRTRAREWARKIIHEEFEAELKRIVETRRGA